MENAEERLEQSYHQQFVDDSFDPSAFEVDIEPDFDAESRVKWHHEVVVSKHVDQEERRRRWRLARSRSAGKIAHPAAAGDIEIQAAGRGGRRASHRVGRAGGGSKKASSDDGGEPPPPPGQSQGAACQILTIKDLAARWSIAIQTIKNRLCTDPHLFPTAIRLPAARGPRWRLRDVELFEAAAVQYIEPPLRKRGRPRINRGTVS